MEELKSANEFILSIFLTDSGCSASCVGEQRLNKYAEVYKDSIVYEKCQRVYQFAGSERVISKLRARFLTVPIWFQIIPEADTPFLIGTDFLENCVVDFPNLRLTIDGRHVDLVRQGKLFGLNFSSLEEIPFLQNFVGDDVYCLFADGEMADDNEEFQRAVDEHEENPDEGGEMAVDYEGLKKLHRKHYHLSAEQMVKRWESFKIDKNLCEAVVTNCEVCSEAKRVRKYTPHRKVFTRPNECVAMDTLFVKWRGEMFAVLHLCCAFTRWSMTFVIEEGDGVHVHGEDVIRALDTWASIFGSNPKSIFTDNGAEFINNQIFTYCSQYGVHHYRSVAYVHRGNGFIERHNGILRRIIEKLSYVDASAVEKLTVADLCRWSCAAKNSYIRNYQGELMSAQRIAFQNDICWDGDEASDEIVVSEWMKQRNELKNRAAALVNTEAEFKEVKQDLMKNSDEQQNWETGDKVRVLVIKDLGGLSDKEIGVKRFQSGEVVGRRGNRVIIVRYENGDVHEVHSSRLFSPLSKDLIIESPCENQSLGNSPIPSLGNQSDLEPGTQPEDKN